MKVFVGYSRQDNVDCLDRIEEVVVERFGAAYLDDKHFPPGIDREEAVHAALQSADVFVAVITPNYLRTIWTSKELDLAEKLGLGVYSLMPDGTLVESSPDEIRVMQGQDLACGAKIAFPC